LPLAFNPLALGTTFGTSLFLFKAELFVGAIAL
jgi:hypothetical protein